MNGAEIVLILLLAVCVVAYLAMRVRLATPIAFVVAGMALAVVPGFPAFEIPPDWLLMLFLPPLLTEAAYFTSPRDFIHNKRPILQLAIGLTIATCVAVAYTVNWLVPEMSLTLGFVLGAIISPPDAVAAVSMTRQVNIPKRLMTILEGESLINDATGLVLYKFAVAAVVTGTFSLAEASLHFVWMVASGITCGWLIGWAFMRIFPRIKEMSVEILSTFLVPYASYLLVESLDGSGVLAVVTTGLTVGWYAPERFGPTFRIPANAVWKMVTFVLNGLVFLIIGLHFPTILKNISDYSWMEIIDLTVAVPLVAIVVRFVWVYAVAYGTRFLMPSVRKADPYPPWPKYVYHRLDGYARRGFAGHRAGAAVCGFRRRGVSAPGFDYFPRHRGDIGHAAVAARLCRCRGWCSKLSLMYDGNLLWEQWQAKKEAAEVDLMRRLERDENRLQYPVGGYGAYCGAIIKTGWIRWKRRAEYAASAQ